MAPAHRHFRRLPLRARSQLARYSIAAFVAAVDLQLIALGRSALTVEGTGSPAAVSSSGGSASGRPMETAAGWSITVLGLLAFGAFVFWLHRVALNWTTQGKPRFHADWAVLVWFVPPLNLWRPVGIMIDLFADRPGMRRIDKSDARLIGTWWLTGLCGLGGRAYLSLWPGQGSPQGPAGGPGRLYLELMVYGLLIISALAAMRLVSVLTARHDVLPRY